MVVQVAFGSFDRGLCRIQINKLLFSNSYIARFTGSPQAALNAAHACTCTRSRSRTNTKGSPLDNFEEAQQVFLLLGRRRILCSLVLNSHLRETLTWTRVLRTRFHAGDRTFRQDVIYFPWSFTHTLQEINFEALLFCDKWMHFVVMDYKHFLFISETSQGGRD